MNNLIGNNIKNLREEKGLTQDMLAERMFVGRQAISKWERGVTIPDLESIALLCQIFNVDFDELVSGKRNNFLSKLAKLYDKFSKTKKAIIKIVVVLLIICMGLLIYYFLNTYKSIKMYEFYGESEDVNVTNGLLFVSKDKIYFKLGEIDFGSLKVNKDPDLELYYMDNEKKELIFACTSCKNINLWDFYGYNAYFDYYKVDDIIKDMYLDITFQDKVISIKLDVKKDYENKFFNKKVKGNIYNYSDNSYDNNVSSNLINKIENTFTKQDDGYAFIYEDDELKKDFRLLDNNLVLSFYSKDGKLLREWQYSFINDILYYAEYNESIEIMYSFENKNCLIGNCQNIEEINNIFWKELYKCI